MKERIPYTAPVALTLVLEPAGTLLEWSNYGENNAPGQGFSGGNIIDNPQDF